MMKGLGELLEKAFRKGCRFDGWSEILRFDLWQEAIAEPGINPEEFHARTRDQTKICRGIILTAA